MSEPRLVLITGGTGYLGRAIIPILLGRGHRVRALVRQGSETKLAAGVEPVIGSPLRAGDIERALGGVDTVVHLVGVPKPSPAKTREFRAIDLVSIQATVAAIGHIRPSPHLIYLSVAQPTPVMQAYVAVRREGEALISAAGLPATCLRPWYVLGPGHRWPIMLLPFYFLLSLIPSTRAGARRLGFVTLSQMVSALVQAVEQPPTGIRIVEVPAIRSTRGISGNRSGEIHPPTQR